MDARFQRKLDFLDWELGVFFHFGIRTYYEGHIDWDMKEMDASAFNPTELDCEQWISTIAAAGAKYAILVCKHHDGFANWPSAYTDYSVANTPWKDGKGDIVREFTDACRKYNLKVGLYYSPAQFGSSNQDSTDYDTYFINQISELLTNYGKIDYLWFDGCGSEEHEYDQKRIIGAIRSMQPEILIFNMWDPDTRWIGNEDGIAGLTDGPETNSLDFSVQTERKDLLEEEIFMPAECDCKIRKNWFYGVADLPTLKSLDELWGMYLYSVGHGANLLLNIGPDRRGLLMDEDVKRFTELGEKIKKEFSNPVCTFDQFRREDDKMVVDVPRDTPVRWLVIEEDLTEGSAVTEYDIEMAPTQFGEFKTVFRGYKIGHKAIIPMYNLPTRCVVIKVTGKRKDFKFRNITIY